MDLIDGQTTGCVRISFGYMSTLEDAQAFLRFIRATRLRPSHGQPLPLATPGEAGAPPGDSEAQNAVPATRVRGSPSPQEDASPHSGVWNNSPTAFNAEDLCPPLLEATKHGLLWDTEETGAASQTAGTAEHWGAEGRTITSRAETRASAISRQPENQSPGQVRGAPDTHWGSQERRGGPSAPHASTCEHLENCRPRTRSGERQHVRRPNHC